MSKLTSVQDAVKLIKDGDTVAFGGFVGAVHAEEVTAGIQASFLETASPEPVVWKLFSFLALTVTLPA